MGDGDGFLVPHCRRLMVRWGGREAEPLSVFRKGLLWGPVAVGGPPGHWPPVVPSPEYGGPGGANRLGSNMVTMESVLREGDLVVCPEGTTCHEPHLLRFSPLFAEVSHEVVPVALHVHVDMFYGTTGSGFKGLDPLYFTMNPFPWYVLEFMEKVPTGPIDGKECRSREVANYVQEKIGKALGFECTPLTRRDKYLMLAGNEGIIDAEAKGR